MTEDQIVFAMNGNDTYYLSAFVAELKKNKCDFIYLLYKICSRIFYCRMRECALAVECILPSSNRFSMLRESFNQYTNVDSSEQDATLLILCCLQICFRYRAFHTHSRICHIQVRMI